jgi:hypothetical protein
MSTSGTATFSRNRDQLIKSALRKCSAFESGETPDSDSIQDASDALNAMIKHWQASGIHIWRMAEATLTPVIGQASYSLGTVPSEKPLKITSARRFNTTSLIDVPLQEMDRIEYQEMPNKTTTGAVNSFFYDRRAATNATGLIYLWPAPETTDEVIKYTYARPIQDFNAAGDDADFPPEWTRAVEWGLADELADEYDVPEPKRTRIERRAAQYLAEVNWWERELTSIEFVPDNGR